MENDRLRITVDFNTMAMDERQRIWINTRVDKELLDILQHGRQVILYDPPDEVEAVLEVDEYEDGRVEWYGVPDWSTRREKPSE